MEDISKGIIVDEQFYDKEDLIDMIRLQKQLVIEENILFTLEECFLIWEGYSSDLMAGWLYVPKNDEDILKHIKSNDYFKSFEDYLKTK